jgi:hypothetical protein
MIRTGDTTGNLAIFEEGRRMPRQLSADRRNSRHSGRCHLQFRIRDLLVIVFLVAGGLGWWVDRTDFIERLRQAERELEARDQALASAAREHEAERDQLVAQYWSTMGLVERMARTPSLGTERSIPRRVVAGQVLSVDRAQDRVDLSLGLSDGVERGDVVTVWQTAGRRRKCTAIVRLLSVSKSSSVGHVMHGYLQPHDLAVGMRGGVLCGMDFLDDNEWE